MAQPKSVVGLDVHATQTHACVLSPETGELRARRLNGPPRRALDYLEGLQAPVLAVYEAGPTGYGLARGGAERGLDVRVCAPGSIPKRPATGSRPTAATPSAWPGCALPGNCATCGCRALRRSASATSPVPGRRSAPT